jgi:hypothetical protein
MEITQVEQNAGFCANGSLSASWRPNGLWLEVISGWFLARDGITASAASVTPRE